MAISKKAVSCGGSSTVGKAMIVETENLNERFRLALGRDYEVVDALPQGWRTAKQQAVAEGTSYCTTKTNMDKAVSRGALKKKRFKISGEKQPVSAYCVVEKIGGRR